MNILAGDVGGTKTDLAIHQMDRRSLNPLAEETFPSEEYPNLESILHEFLRKVEVDSISVRVSGPVIEGRASITNLSWIIDERELKEEFKLTSVLVINDLVATAYFVPHLASEKDVYLLNRCSPAMNGAQTPIDVLLTSRAALFSAAHYSIGVRKSGENS